MDHMRWGILGASSFALEHMGPAIHAARGAQLAAVASRSPDKVAAFQAFAPQTRALDSYDGLLADDGIDAVYIPLPHTMHKEWTIKALAAGKHVLAEKPIAMVQSDFAELIAVRDTAGKLAAEAYMIVHHPQWQRVRALIQDGAIGTVMRVHTAFSYDNSGDPKNIRNHQDTGGGGLRDIGVYTLGCARWALGGDITDISAQVRLEDGFDTYAACKGAIGDAQFSMYTSTRMHLHQEATFHGTAGLIRLTAPFNPGIFGEARVELHQADMGLRVERFPQANQYVTQVETFGHCAASGDAYPWSLEMAQGTQAAIDDILRTATRL